MHACLGIRAVTYTTINPSDTLYYHHPRAASSHSRLPVLPISLHWPSHEPRQVHSWVLSKSPTWTPDHNNTSDRTQLGKNVRGPSRPNFRQLCPHRYITSGFRIGFGYGNHSLRPTGKNLRSAYDHPKVVDLYLQNEVSLNRVAELTPATLPWFQVNSFGVIPKPHKPGKWRLIVDLSAPEGHSINDFIPKENCSISYISVDLIANTILHLGQGAMLAKADVQEAFRTIPVNPTDRLLLAMEWKGSIFLDKVLPFGLRSAPIIFTAVADALEWIVRCQGVPYISHYVDDFILVGKPHSSDYANSLATMLRTCASLGVPIAPEKCEGPAKLLTVQE